MAVVALLVAYLSSPATAATQTTQATDLGAWLAHRVSLMDSSDPYRVPTTYEKSVAANALKAQDAGTAVSTDAAKIGITASKGTDAATGRPYTMLASETDTERSWGAVVVDRSKPVRLVIEIPHPKDDINTSLIGLSLFRKVPGSALVVAGTKRDAGTDADMAHTTNSVFQAYAAHEAVQAGKEAQIHGFADSALPGINAIPSPGPTTATSLHSAVASALTSRGLTVCKGWVSYCGDLRGTTNAQGSAAKARGSQFLHIETSRTVRDSSTSRDKVASAIAATWG